MNQIKALTAKGTKVSISRKHRKPWKEPLRNDGYLWARHKIDGKLVDTYPKFFHPGKFTGSKQWSET